MIKFKDITSDSKATFDDIDVGETFVTKNSSDVYIKISKTDVTVDDNGTSRPVNAFCLSYNYLIHFNKTDKVNIIDVSAKVSQHIKEG